MPIPKHTFAAVIGVFFLLTTALGLALRWEFVTGYLSAHGYNFANLRHAHSHGGYYVVLTLPVFWALSRAAPLPRLLVGVYVVLAAAASVGFAFVGYQVVTIVLSTLILCVWLWAAWGLRGVKLHPWLHAAAVNLVAGGLLIPVIGVLSVRDWELATRVAHAFLTLLLLGVYVPVLWSLLGVARRRSLLVWEAVFLPAAGAMVFDSEAGLTGRLAVALFGAFLFETQLGAPWHGRRRFYGWGLGALVTAGALLPHPMPAELRIAGIHFVVLGPAMHMVFAVFARRRVWLGYDVALFAMLAAIAFAPHFWPAESMRIVAMVSSVFVAALLQPVYLLVTGRARAGQIPAG